MPHSSKIFEGIQECNSCIGDTYWTECCKEASSIPASRQHLLVQCALHLVLLKTLTRLLPTAQSCIISTSDNVTLIQVYYSWQSGYLNVSKVSRAVFFKG